MTETEKREILDAIAVIEAQIYYKRDIFDKNNKYTKLYNRLQEYR